MRMTIISVIMLLSEVRKPSQYELLDSRAYEYEDRVKTCHSKMNGNKGKERDHYNHIFKAYLNRAYVSVIIFI